MLNKFKFYIYIAIGVIAIGLSIACFNRTIDELSELPKEYKELSEGLQQSTRAMEKSLDRMDGYFTITSKLASIRDNAENYNKKVLSLIQFGFGSILLISGLGFIAVGITSPLPKKDQEGDNE